MVKPHGLAGEVVVKLVSNRTERMTVGTTFLAGDQTLCIASVRPFQGRFLVNFEGVTSRQQADSLRGVELRSEAMEDPEVMWVHELVGAHVVLAAAPDGPSVGTVTAVVSNPASDLLELEDGRLIPVCFVTGHDADRVVVDVPAGLLD